MATGKNVHKILLCFPHDIALNCGGTKKAVPNITSLSAIRKANVLFVLLGCNVEVNVLHYIAIL